MTEIKTMVESRKSQMNLEKRIYTRINRSRELILFKFTTRHSDFISFEWT